MIICDYICQLKTQLWEEVIKKPKKERFSKDLSVSPGQQAKRKLQAISQLRQRKKHKKRISNIEYRARNFEVCSNSFLLVEPTSKFPARLLHAGRDIPCSSVPCPAGQAGISRSQPLNLPFSSIKAILNPVVQTTWSSLPEFNDHRLNNITTPVSGSL